MFGILIRVVFILPGSAMFITVENRSSAALWLRSEDRVFTNGEQRSGAFRRTPRILIFRISPSSLASSIGSAYACMFVMGGENGSFGVVFSDLDSADPMAPSDYADADVVNLNSGEIAYWPGLPTSQLWNGKKRFAYDLTSTAVVPEPSSLLILASLTLTAALGLVRHAGKWDTQFAPARCVWQVASAGHWLRKGVDRAKFFQN